VAASQEIYSALKKAGEKLPVVVSMGGVAASGGYYVAVAADTIVANPGTTTGSIGVIATLAQVFRLMDKIGIDHEVIKSGKFKDSGSALRKMTPEDRQYLQGWIDDAYQQFVETVAEERNMPLSKVKKIADGRVFTGRQALELGLIDKLGDFQDAIDLAGKMGGIKGKPEILEKKKRRLTLFDLLFGDVNEFLTKLTSKHIEFQYIMP
jgi:protease-4